MLGSLFRKVTGLQGTPKETPTELLSRELCKIFKNIYFEKHLRAAFLSVLPGHTWYKQIFDVLITVKFRVK